jgi:hypothetical protein
MPGAASVEAKDELVEVGLEVLAAQAVIDAERPAFGIGEDAAGPGQHDRAAMRPTACGSRAMPVAPGDPDQPSVLAVAPGARLALRKGCRLAAE